MKKTLVAVAALAASAAFAQSSVTLYGVADAYVGVEKLGGGKNQAVVQDGGLSPSRLGVSVKEDLGAGLSAFAVIERGHNLDTGAGAGTRKSVVGLSGDFGSVSLGQQDTPLADVVLGFVDAQGEGAFSAVSASAKFTPAGGYALNGAARGFANSVRYDTPNFDGFSAAAQVASSEVGGRDYAFNVTYANGPLGAAFAYQNDNRNAAKTAVVGGYYDFGAAKLNLGYSRESVAGTKEFSAGVTVPVDAFTFVGQVANTKVGGVKSLAFGLEGRYALSKRTTGYAGLVTEKTKPGAREQRFGVGLRHVF